MIRWWKASCGIELFPGTNSCVPHRAHVSHSVRPRKGNHDPAPTYLRLVSLEFPGSEELLRGVCRHERALAILRTLTQLLRIRRRFRRALDVRESGEEGVDRGHEEKGEEGG